MRVHIGMSERLKERATECARLEGVELPEFIRIAISLRCEDTERRAAVREVREERSRIDG